MDAFGGADDFQRLFRWCALGLNAHRTPAPIAQINKRIHADAIEDFPETPCHWQQRRRLAADIVSEFCREVLNAFAHLDQGALGFEQLFDDAIQVEAGIGHGFTAASDGLVLKLMLTREF